MPEDVDPETWRRARAGAGRASAGAGAGPGQGGPGGFSFSEDDIDLDDLLGGLFAAGSAAAASGPAVPGVAGDRSRARIRRPGSS